METPASQAERERWETRDLASRVSLVFLEGLASLVLTAPRVWWVMQVCPDPVDPRAGRETQDSLASGESVTRIL